MLAKPLAILAVFALAAVPSAMGQAADAEPLSVEEMMIRETSASHRREQNMFALAHTESAIGRGGAGPEVYAALERLVFSGSLTRSMGRGRVVNNFPDVRREAARQLGELGSEEARAILLRAAMVEREPKALQEIIGSLALIEAEDNAQTVAVIVRVGTRAHFGLLPNNHVAFAAVNALGVFVERDGGLADAGAFNYLFAVAEGPYVLMVRERAWEVIDSLRAGGGG